MNSPIKRVFSDVKGVFLKENTPQMPRQTPRQFSEWQNVPEIARQLALRERGGDLERYQNFYDYAITRWGSRLAARPLSALVIGVSHCPELPRMLLASGRVKNILAVDSDSVALENLLEQGHAEVECWQMDLSSEPLPKGPFDIVATNDSLNHIRDIEHIGNQIEKVMDRGGLFVSREYVGPDRLQFSVAQRKMADAFLALLPQKYRRCSSTGILMDGILVPDLEMMQRIDPTKAIESERIENMINLRFKIMEEIPLGGTILAPLLMHIAANFSDEDPQGIELIRNLIKMEMGLIDGGLLKCDYKAIIGRLS